MPFGAAGTVVKGTGTTCNVPVPAGVAAGKLVKIIIYLQVADAVTSTDFVQKYDISTSPTTRGGFRVLWKRATANDSGTYTVNWTNSSLFEAWAVVHSGIHSNGDPFETANNSQSTSNTATTIGTGAITNAFTCDVCCVYSNHATNAGAWTPDASQTERFEDGANPPGHLMMSSQDSIAPSSPASKVATLTGTTGNSLPKGLIYGLRTESVPTAPKVLGYAELTTGDVSWTYLSTSDSRTSQEIRINGGTPISLGAGDSTYHITGLTNETVYTVEVRGINVVGTGPWSVIKRIITGSSIGGVNRRYFTAVQSWTPPAGVTSVKRLIVGGAGAGGTHPTGATTGGGGAGAGGVDEDLAESVTPGVPIDVVGGLGGIGQVLVGATWQGNNGELSKFGSTICDGGGGGGTNVASSDADGVAGGSGGGAGGTGGGGASTIGGAATGNGLGNAGGNGFNTAINGNTRAGGGGGGAAAAGTNGSSQNGGEGGDGYLYDTSVFGTLIGASNRVAAGGGGGRNNSSGGTVGVGGLGGGANGAFNNAPASAGTDLTGSGGGGGGNDPNSGRGSDGFVVLVWEDPAEQTSYWGIKAA